MTTAANNADADAADVAAIAGSIRVRSTGNRWGIGTVAQYLKSVESCMDGIATAEQFAKAVADAEHRLTWCEEGGGDTDLMADSLTLTTKAAGATTGAAAASAGAVESVPDGFCGMFDCTLTSRRQDRDGDILEPKGLTVDPNMPLLWQHVPMQPIGRLLKVLSQDENSIKCRFGIADTALGRDVAKLIATKCLRMSHGFKPFEAEPIFPKDAAGKAVVGGAGGAGGEVKPEGWHVKRGEIREGSVVSIPSNVDGTIAAFTAAAGEGVLETAAVKAWVKACGGVTTKSAENTAMAANVAAKAAAEVAAKSAAAPENKASGETLAAKSWASMGYLDGSFEAISASLRSTAAAYLQAKGIDTENRYCFITATFADNAIVGYYSGNKEANFRVPYEMKDTGPQWSGDPVAVEIKPTVMEKAAADAGLIVTKDAAGGIVVKEAKGDGLLALKAGRKISKETHGQLSACRDKMKACREHMDEAHKIIHKMVEENDPDAHASAHMPDSDPDSPKAKAEKSADASGSAAPAPLAAQAAASAPAKPKAWAMTHIVKALQAKPDEGMAMLAGAEAELRAAADEVAKASGVLGQEVVDAALRALTA